MTQLETPAKTLGPRVEVLDGFRGVAVLLVVAYHYGNLLGVGWIGVDLFFILSGFLITRNLYFSVGKQGYLWVFYTRRLLRLLPLYYSVLAFFFLILPLTGFALTSSYYKLLALQEYYWFFVINFQNAVAGFPDNITLVHFWSLACEMQFYFLWPFLILLFRRSIQQLAYVFLFLILAATALRVFQLLPNNWPQVSYYLLLPTRLDCFAAGGLLFLIQEKLIRWVPSTKILIVLLIPILIFASGILGEYHFVNKLVQQAGFSLNLVFWWILLWYALSKNANPVFRFFSSRILKFFGKYSYSIYVFHLPVLITVSQVSFIRKQANHELWQAMLALIITIPLSIASFHLLEKRFLKLKPAFRNEKG